MNPDVLLTNLKVQMGSKEFERIFDVYAEDNFFAMRLFTPDAMHDLIKLYTTSSSKFEATIQNDTLYIRFSTGEIFRAPEDLDVPIYRNFGKNKCLKYRYDSIICLSLTNPSFLIIINLFGIKNIQLNTRKVR